MNNDIIIREYAQQIEKEKEKRREKDRSTTYGLIPVSHFTQLINGIPIHSVEGQDYGYEGPWTKLILPAYEQARNKELGNKNKLVFGAYRGVDGVVESNSTILILNDDKSLTVRKDYEYDETVTIYQMCEEGVYVFSISGTYSNNTPWKFEFYPNEGFVTESIIYGCTPEEVKRRFVTGVGYSVAPSKVWKSPRVIAEFLPNQYFSLEQVPCSVSFSDEDRCIIANKLFREGLDKVFKSGHLEVTDEDRKIYSEQEIEAEVEKLEEEKIDPIVERQVEEQETDLDVSTFSLLSQEEKQKLELLTQLKDLGMDLSEDQKEELKRLKDLKIKTDKFREYQKHREERDQHIKEGMTARAQENEERNAHWIEGEKQHQEKEEREKAVVDKMKEETRLLEQLAQVMPLSDMQKVVLRLNKIYTEAYDIAKHKIEMQQMTEEQKAQVEQDLSTFYQNKK